LFNWHRGIVSRFLDIYTSTDGFTIDGGEVFSGLGVVEGVNSPSWNTAIIDKLVSVA
jgi:hypothetical protein